MSYANNKGKGQPAHPRSLIGVFVVRCLDSIIPILVSVAEQASLSLTWSQINEDTFSNNMASIYINIYIYIYIYIYI